MNKIISVILILSLFCLPAFAQKKKKRAKKIRHATESRYQAPAPKPEDKVTYVRMYHSACFGRCPIHWIEIFPDGRVRYSGGLNSEHLGVYEKNIGTSVTGQFLKTVAGYRVDTCQDRYEVRISDIPGMICNVTMNGVTKTVYNAHFGPGYFQDMSREMDDFAKVDASWKKIADTAIYKP